MTDQSKTVPTVFSFESHPIRTLDRDGEIWFVAADVCKVLGIKNTTDALKILDDEDRASFNLGGGHTANIISEPGLFTLVLRSDKPIARKLQRWVTKDVLPSIRKTGSYTAPGAAQAPALPEVLTPADLGAMLDKPMQITVREYLALTQGKGDPQAAPQVGHSNGQHYSDEIRAQVLDLGDKGWMPAEISERTGVPKDTVATMLFRARKAGKIAKGPRQGTLARDAKKGGVA